MIYDCSLEQKGTPCLQCSKDMDFSALRHEILRSNKSASEKAEMFLHKSQLFELSRDEWRKLAVGVPADVGKEIVVLQSAGTELHLHTWLIVQVSNRPDTSFYFTSSEGAQSKSSRPCCLVWQLSLFMKLYSHLKHSKPRD